MSPLYYEENLNYEILESNCMTLEQKHALKLVNQYGQDSLNYLVLSEDKQLFFGQKTEGCMAYVIILNVAVCIGNPICPKTKKVQFLDEFRNYCKEKKLKICFCSISQEIADVLKNNDFYIVKYGEEALIDLRTYELTGGKTLKLRQKLRRAEKSGVRVYEYDPYESRDYDLEGKIDELSAEWFTNKKGKLTFSVGELHLNEPLDRRYFISMNERREIFAVLMFSPFSRGKGYFLDVMRRKKDAIPGVMEHAIITASMKMKTEGIEMLSLGVAPLAGIDPKEEGCTRLEKYMNFVYHHVNSDYGFKSLYQYKKKFSPTEWRKRYVAYEKGLNFIKVGYVMIKARNAKGIIRQIVRGLHNKRKSAALDNS